MPVLFAPKVNRNTSSFTSSVSNRPTSPSQPANNVSRFQPTYPSDLSPKEVRREVQRRLDNRRGNSTNYQSPQSRGGNIGETRRATSPQSGGSVTAARKAREAERLRYVEDFKRARQLEKELADGITRRSRPSGYPSVPKPTYPKTPKTNFPTRLPKFKIPLLPPGVNQLAPLLFPDALNEGEDDYLDRLARRTANKLPPKKLLPIPDLPNEPFTRFYAMVSIVDVYTRDVLIPGSPSYSSGDEVNYHLWEWSGRIRELGSENVNESTFYDIDLVGYTRHFIRGFGDVSNSGGIGMGIGGVDMSVIAIWTARPTTSFPIPGEPFDDDGEGLIWLPPESPIELEPPPAIRSPTRKPRWRPRTPTSTPPELKPPWEPWDTPERPPISPPQLDPPPVTDPPRFPFPLPPFQKFPNPTETPNEEEQCKPGQDCMTCRFSPAVVQQIVNNAVNQARQQIEQNDDGNTQDIREDISELRSRLDLLDLLQQILDLLLQQSGEEDPDEEDPEFISITVAVVEKKEDGTYEEKTKDIKGHKNEVEQVKLKFRKLADMMLLVAPMSKNVRRTYRILGGDYWYQTTEDDDDSRTPELDSNVERSLIVNISRLFDLDSGRGKEDGMLTGDLVKLIQTIGSCIYYRSGFHTLPGEVPKTLLSLSDDQGKTEVFSTLDYQTWFIKQFDALVGQFPIEIEVKDIDPAKEGDQTKKIELPNISEALAEMYALALSGATNADLSINFLMRLAAETIATKNAALITQDYTKANAAFLGYKGNPARREIDYAFNPTKLDTLDQLLQNSKGYIQGWEEDDKESVVGFLQRIVFSAGIIKSVFFRDDKRMKELKKELENMLDGDKKLDDDQWKAFLEMINTGASPFNQVEDNPKPKIDKQVNYKAPVTGSTTLSTGGGISGGISTGGGGTP